MIVAKRLINRWSAAAIVLLCVTGVGCFYLAQAYVQSTADNVIRAARRSLAAGHSGKARDAVRWLLWFDPSHPESLVIRGKSLLAEGDTSAAIASLEKVPRDNDAHREAGFPLAIALLGSSRLAEAEEVLADYVSRFPQNREARNELRWLYFNEFRTRDVIALLENSLQPPSNDLSTLPDLLDSEYHAQTPYEGLAYLDKINRQLPDQPAVMTGLAYCHWQMGKLDEAERLLQRAATLAPDNLEVRLLWSNLLIDRRRTRQAHNILAPGSSSGTTKEELERDDRYWQLCSRLAELDGDVPTALKYLTHALRLRPRERIYLARQADLLRLSKHEAQASQISNLVSRLARAEQELRSMMEAGKHHNPSAEDCRKIADLCRELGKTVQADGWLQVIQRFRSTPQL